LKKPDTYMPLVIGDYLKDTMHLTAQEHGAYLLAIMHYWTTGPLPDDDRKLAAICRIDRAEWPGVRETVAAFFQVADGIWRHKRIDKELERAQRLKARAVEAGRASADARATKSQLNTQLDGNLTSTKGSTKRQLKVNPATATATSEDNQNNTDRVENIIAPSRKREAAVVLPPDWVPSEAENKFALEMGLTPDEAAREAIKFRAYWVNGTGGGTRRKPSGWASTWQNWISRTADNLPRGNQNEQPTRPRYNPADASSPESVAERRAKILDGMRATFPGFGTEGDGG